MTTRPTFHVLIQAMLVMLLALFLACPTQVQLASAASIAPARLGAPAPALYLTPETIGPGGVLLINGSNFSIGQTGQYRILLNTGAQVYTLTTGYINPKKEIRASAQIPPLASGVYTVEAHMELYPLMWSLVDTHLVTITNALIVTPSPTNPKVGETVTYTVSSLLTGTLRLEYGGLLIAGSIPVGQGSYSATFIVPTNRRLPPGTPITLTATNLINGYPVNRGEAVLQTQAEPPFVAPSLLSITPPLNITAGETFTVSGVISGLVDDRSRYDIHMMWNSFSGGSFPIDSFLDQLSPDGTFRVIGDAPSLYRGDAGSASLGDSFQLFLGDADRKLLFPLGSSVPISGLPPDMELSVQVFRADTGQPLPNAEVVIVPLGKAECEEPEPAQADGLERAVTFGYNPGYPPENQIQGYLGLVQLEDRQWSAVTSHEPRATAKETDLFGGAHFNFQLELGQLSGLSAINFKTFEVGGIFKPHALHRQPTAPQVSCVALPGRDKFGLQVTALYTPSDPYEYEPYLRDLLFNSKTGGLFFADTFAPINGTLLVNLPVIATPFKGVHFVGPFLNPAVLKFKGDIETFAGGLSLTPVQGDGTVNTAGVPNTPVRFSFDLNPDEAKLVGQAKLYINDQLKGDLLTTTISGGVRFYYDLADPYRVLPPGEHTFSARLFRADFPQASLLLSAYFDVGGLPEWFTTPSTTGRAISFDSTKVVNTLRGTQAPPAAQPLNSPGALNTVGELNSQTGVAPMEQVVTIDAKRHQTSDVKTTSEVAALNNPGQGYDLAFNGGGATTFDMRTCAKALVPFCFDTAEPEKITLFETGWVPVYRNGWGIWPIAEATVGVDTAATGKLSLDLSLIFQEKGIKASRLFMDPDATASINAWLDVSVLLGAVEAGISARPTLGVNMPLVISQFHTTSPKLESVNACLRYKMDFAWFTKIGWCPLCDRESGVEPIIPSGHVVPPWSSSAACGDPLMPTVALTVTPPPSRHPALVSDGFGLTMSAWQNASGDLVSYLNYRGNWINPQIIAQPLGVGKPYLAAYAPGKVLALWSQSSYTDVVQFQTATLTQTARSQQVWYATWDGAWSQPLTVTAPSTGGDFGPTLTACPATTPNCPDTGEVTAAWVRDMTRGGALGNRNFQVYYSRYQPGTGWSAPLPVVSPTIVSTNNQPQIAYTQVGTPTVAWVHDPDQRLATTHDRVIWMRALDGASPVVTPTLPNGIAEFSLTFSQEGDPRFAFTVIEASGPNLTQTGGLIGNRHFLYSGGLTSGNWQFQRLQDGVGRPIRAEKPILLFDHNNQAQITFRGLGFGPLANGLYLSPKTIETLGMARGTGELVSARVDFAKPTLDLNYLSTDGALNWQSEAIFDSATNNFQYLTIKDLVASPDPSGPHLAQWVAADEPIASMALPNQPDFVIETVTLSAPYPTVTQTFSASLVIHNSGASLTTTNNSPLTVTATWDGGYGEGEPAGETALSVLDAGESITLTLNLTLPTQVNRPHTLLLTLNPHQAILETNLDNNGTTLLVGGLPAPTAVRASADLSTRYVFLRWSAPNDPRVAGYRIYRSTDGGPVEPVGSSLANGFVDMTTTLGHTYQYYVVSFTTEGDESPLSEMTQATTTQSFQLYLPLLQR